ncbi:MAG: glycosyltransferase family 2 protein [Oscillospiraceae bacterium]|nr:glycosyltransferase family 2 protein [Oscillospiraceae bacterium]
MKLISFAIPSYNSESYLHHAVESILTGGEEVEILIINDGSTDGTAAIADRFAQQYPTIVKAIHKPNGGHGSGVNRGLQEAQGLYYKVVDSDDWVNEKALKALLTTIRRHVTRGIEADLYLTNFIYDHAEDNTKNYRRWDRQCPEGRIFSWDEVKPFYGPEVLLMHSLLYKTELLRSYGIVLPEHTFYVDNLFAYAPLPHAKKLFYLNVDLYHYFIGRADQSVTLANITKRYDQQIRVMLKMTDAYSYDEIMAMESGLGKYMLHCLSAIMMNTLMFCCSGGDTPERRKAYDQLWAHILERDPKLYGHLRKKGLPLMVCWMPWKLRGKAMLFGYNFLCKTIKLG